ncbi:MAG TPA: SDR family NAD(P)-dependent oxidoreductase, partial [Solirubrobacteraceae bacterium]
MNGRVAFITGASRGVGAAVARAFHGLGARVALASRTGDDLGLEGALGVECDVTSRESVDAAVAATVEQFGSLEVVVANAGVGAYGPFLEMDPADMERMIEV